MKYFTKSHEWLELDGAIATIGISNHAQELLGDVVFVEIPEVGTQLSAGEVCGSIESVKAASDIYAPVSGAVTEINPQLVDQPEIVNEAAESAGWLFKLRLDDSEQLSQLLDSESYQQLVADA